MMTLMSAYSSCRIITSATCIFGNGSRRLGIKKKIIRHCARHSFAVNVLTKGANIKTVSSLLGHTSIKMTERYLHVVDSLKQDAINSLGEINYAPM